MSDTELKSGASQGGKPVTQLRLRAIQALRLPTEGASAFRLTLSSWIIS